MAAAERGYWSGLTTLQKVAVVLGIPAGATVLYILYRRYRESRGGCRSPPPPGCVPVPPPATRGPSAASPVAPAPLAFPGSTEVNAPGISRAAAGPSLAMGRPLE